MKRRFGDTIRSSIYEAFFNCRICGSKLTASTSKGNGGSYGYYHCQHRCPERFGAVQAHFHFIEYLRCFKVHPEIAKLYLEILKDIFQEKEDDKKKALEKMNDELSSIEKDLGEIDNAFYLRKSMEADSYRRLKDNLSQRKTELVLRKEDFAKAGDSFMEYQTFGVSLVTNLDTAFEHAPSEMKGRILGSIFPERLVYEDKKYRTTKLNEVVGLLWNFQAGFEEIETGQAITTNHLSCLAPRVGLEPTTLRLQWFRHFHAGLDYLIIPYFAGVGRFRGLLARILIL